MLTRNLDFPVKPYKGTKSVVISTVSWIGGKNPFLGWAYVAAAAVFVLLAVLGTIRHLVRPRFVPVMTCFLIIQLMIFVLQATGRYVVVVVESVSVGGLRCLCIRPYISLCIMLVREHTVPLFDDNDLFMILNILSWFCVLA